MKPGTDVGEIEAAIKAYNPALKISTLTGKTAAGGEFTAAIQAVSTPRPQPGTAGDNIIVAFTVAQPGKAFYIGRFTAFAQGQQPTIDNIMQELKTKYGGQPGSIGGMGLSGLFAWAFDKTGKQIIPKTMADPSNELFGRCAHTVEQPRGGLSYGLTYPTDGSLGVMVVPKFLYADCGVSLKVQTFQALTPALLGTLVEQLYSDPLAAADIRKAMDDAKAAQDRQQQEQLQQQLEQQKKAVDLKTRL